MVGRLLSGLSYSDGKTSCFIVLMLLVSGSVITKNPFIAIYCTSPFLFQKTILGSSQRKTQVFGT